ncbi:hypothetical protein L21_1299 [Methanoculleus chikugoensis]|jgi:ABC-2 type transport system permease protein|uniref:Uncharacterized protein n=1 Tax=Methanoculleus chikugoensis TaxID=118126 RepID=A0A1M4MKP3_9EURY|nr:hypothetical protein L21_1299 [Methanoculleus chikugoensis]
MQRHERESIGMTSIMNFVIFPIFGLSGALFPINSLPA